MEIKKIKCKSGNEYNIGVKRRKDYGKIQSGYYWSIIWKHKRLLYNNIFNGQLLLIYRGFERGLYIISQ